MLRWFLRLCALAILIAPGTAGAAEGDVPGSADYPLVGRFEGTVITSYEMRDFDEYTLPTGPARGRDGFESVIDLEGRLTRISYKRGPGPSSLEVDRNFQQKLEASGFEILYSCKAADCGLTDFRYGIDTVSEPRMVIDSWNYYYVAARKTGDRANTHVSILTSTNNNNIYVQVYAIESETMALRMVDAAQMAATISETGRIALYGILFDTDKTDIRPESRPALDEIAALLGNAPELALIVVGHTDSQGDFDYNMSLSQRRAEAVVRDLVSSYGIGQARLRAAGVGYLAPVAHNGSEDGRAQNRRVELIEQ